MNDSAAKIYNKRSRLFVIGFVCLILACLSVAIYTNIIRRPETEAAAASAQAGQNLLKQGQSGVVPEAKKTEELSIQTANGIIKLDVEVMRTPDEQARGLMFRQSMLDNSGMLFDFGLERPVSMWMRNTYLSLDMVFVLANGRIHRIEENAEPLSERTVASGIAVRSVLELKAGTARRLGLKPGDLLVHSIFKPN